jgi:hypothetical protein
MADMRENVDTLPGYRRRIRVEPREGRVLAMLEDDIHCMAVILRHAEGVVTAVEPATERMPWDTCPGAAAKLIETFAGRPLSEVTAKREKRANCTHLHDLAVLAAAHAGDPDALVYDVLVSDPVRGERLLELRRDGKPLLQWREGDGVLVEPEDAAGLPLMALRDWIAALPAAQREPARLLQWASLVAHGRTMPLDQQSHAAAMPPNCYTFQPERAVRAVRVGKLRDFTSGGGEPLDGFGDEQLARL